MTESQHPYTSPDLPRRLMHGDELKSAAAVMGRKGGLVKSDKKTKACRANAKKPRKKEVK